MRWYVEFQVAGGAAQHHELTGLKCAVCGTSSSAHLRLPKHYGLTESFLDIAAKAEGVVLRCASGSGPCIEFANRNYRELCIPWEQDVFVGPVRFCFLQSEGGGQSKRSDCSGILGSLLVMFAGLGVWGMLQAPDAGVVRGTGPEAPALFANEGARCSIPMGKDYRERLSELRHVAEGKMVRYPFDRSLGLEAIRLLEQAQDCTLSVKELSRQSETERAELQSQIRRLKRQVDQDYSGLRLSLESARQKNDFLAVKHFAKKLRGLLALPPSHPYARWLSGLERDAQDALRGEVVSG